MLVCVPWAHEPEAVRVGGRILDLGDPFDYGTVFWTNPQRTWGYLKPFLKRSFLLSGFKCQEALLHSLSEALGDDLKEGRCAQLADMAVAAKVTFRRAKRLSSRSTALRTAQRLQTG